MKIQMAILTAALLALPAFSQTNDHKKSEGSYEQRDHDGRGRDGRRGKGERRDLTPEEKEKMQEYRLAMMEKTLKEIGVSEEQQLQIKELQTQMKEQMREAFGKVEENKKQLKELENSGAPEAEIFAAIDAVAEAQADQMKILARNRIQMERILGKEKFDLFMDSARSKWKEHGRRSGPNLPPLPEGAKSLHNSSLPPVPK